MRVIANLLRCDCPDENSCMDHFTPLFREFYRLIGGMDRNESRKG
jgi:hypothetical protein